MEELLDEKYLNIKFKYEFESFIGEMEGNRYIQNIKASIIKTDENGNEEKIIGKGDIKLLLLAQQ